MFFTRHCGQTLGETVQCSSNDRTPGRRELRLQAEALAVVEVPPRQGAIPVGFLSFFDGRSSCEISLTPDASGGDLLGPEDEPTLCLGRGEPGEFDHLVDAQLPGRERLG